MAGDDNGRSRWRTLMITIFPMFIATLSLVTSVYNGYLNNRFVDLIENNVGRLEYMRTCKEVIEAYFQVKAKASALSAASDLRRAGGAPVDVPGSAEAVARFGALGTYLANLRDEQIRVRYTGLTLTIEKIIADAPSTSRTGLPKLFEGADVEFGALNDDCVKAAKAHRL